MSKLGVIVVTFNSTDVILDCLESLVAAGSDIGMRVVVVDNASSDGTVEMVRDWANGTTPYEIDPATPFDMKTVSKPLAMSEFEQGAHKTTEAPALTVLKAQSNGGFAAGVNLGLEYLAQDPEVGHFWVLNPDSVTPPGTPAAFLKAADAHPGFALMGGRVQFYEQPDLIQIDGGTINWKTGITGNLNKLGDSKATPAPDTNDIAFISGASMLASRKFYETKGPMREDYFLYYEEVDWALMGEELPLAYCADAPIYHKAGTSIGSPSLTRGASQFSLFFKHRARMMFLRAHAKTKSPMPYVYTFAKAAQLALGRDFGGAMAIIRGTFDMHPPREVLERLSPEAKRSALGIHS